MGGPWKVDLLGLPVESSEVQLQAVLLGPGVSSGSQLLPVNSLPVVRQPLVVLYKGAEVTRCPWQ